MGKKVEINGKVALVSGANRGIGKAIVEALIKAGASKVYAGARDISSLDEMKQKHGDKLVPIKLDVTSDEDIAAAAETAGDVEILVNNAGIASPGSFHEGDLLKSLDENFAVNVYGVGRLTKAFLPSLEQKDVAAIAVVASVAGLANMPFALAYSVSKAAVHSMIQGLRAELRETNVLVSGVYPGPIDTDMTKGFEIQKESPENVAKSVVTGLEKGEEDIFPDPMAQQVSQGYFVSPKAVEEQFATFGS